MSNESTFRFNYKILKSLHKKLEYQNRVYSGSRISIPSIVHLKEIISGMLWASTQMEEGRLLRFRVAYAEPPNVSSYGLVFENPIPWEVEEIRKIAPAVVPPDGRLCVFTANERKKLFIKGIEAQPREKDETVFFEIIEPTRIIIKQAGYKTAEITGQTFGFIDGDTSDFIFHLMTLESIRMKEMDTPNHYTSLRYLYGHMTREILKRVRLLRHGGSIIFVPNVNGLDNSVETPIKYKCSQGFEATSLIATSMKRVITEQIKEGKEIQVFAPDGMTDFSTWKASLDDLWSSENRNRMANAARTVAYLMAVDGATILNTEFEVLAFGTKIKESHDDVEECKVTVVSPLEILNRETELVNEFRGKRHLSVARFVIRNHNSIAFAVSQDGGITAFVMESGKLVAYKELELLL